MNPYWFSSKPIHWPSGKYDFLYRWYVPQLDRWPNRDPKGEQGFELIRHPRIIKYRRSFRAFGEIKGVPDLYEFVRNSPVSRIDLLGLNCLDDLVHCVNSILPSTSDVDVDWEEQICQFYSLARADG